MKGTASTDVGGPPADQLTAINERLRLGLSAAELEAAQPLLPAGLAPFERVAEIAPGPLPAEREPVPVPARDG